MPWLKVKNFAGHADVSERTVRELLKTGLPHSRLPSGTILIEIEKADEWLRSFDVDRQGMQIVDDILSDLKL